MGCDLGHLAYFYIQPQFNIQINNTLYSTNRRIALSRNRIAVNALLLFVNFIIHFVPVNDEQGRVYTDLENREKSGNFKGQGKNWKC
jgi:hypothetical protein